MDIKKVRAICMEVLGGYKHRNIAAKYNISPSLVSRFREHLANEGYFPGICSCSDVSSMTDLELAKIIYPNVTGLKNGSVVVVGRPRPDAFVPDFVYLANQVIDSKITRKLCFSLYLEDCEKENKRAISKSDFYRKLSFEIRKIIGTKVYMPQEHPYGQEVCIDFCGQTWAYIGTDKKLRHAPIFVMTWSASYMTYACVVERQTTKCTCEAIGKAFQYFGYIPLTLQFDNGKAAVTTHIKGSETIFNDSFNEYMNRIKVPAISSNPRSPTYKSCVEAMVGVIERNILPIMNHDINLSLEEVNCNLIRQVDKVINKARYREGSSRTREYLFKTYETAKSRKFEGTIPEFYEHIPCLKVGSDYTVDVDGTKYSVPYTLAGEYVSASISGKQIRIMYELQVVATHTISDNGTHQIKLEHMPESHRSVVEKKLKYPTAESIYATALSISESLYRFCKCLIQKMGFDNGKKGCIRLINRYRSRSCVRELMDEAIDRTLNGDPRLWNSNTVLDNYKEVSKEAIFNNGKVAHQTELNFCADPHFAHLRRQDYNSPGINRIDKYVERKINYISIENNRVESAEDSKEHFVSASDEKPNC